MKKNLIVDDKPHAPTLKLLLEKASVQVLAAFLNNEPACGSITERKLGRQMLIMDGFSLYKTRQQLLSNLPYLLIPPPSKTDGKTRNRIKQHNTEILKNHLSIKRLIVPVNSHFFGSIHA